MPDDSTSLRIVKGLTQKPAYLLVFGVCFLLLGGGAATGIVGMLKDTAEAVWVGAGVAFLALLAVVVVVFVVEREGRSVPAGRVGDTDFDPILDAIYDNMRQALGRSHPVFRDRMARETEQYRSTTGLWAAGQLRATERTYNGLLLSVYERAEKSVFATSTLDYLPAWKSFLGPQILEAHERSKAEVTRVFLFDSRRSVSDDAIEQMRMQAGDSKIKIRVYGILENVRYEFPKDQNMNFAVIDDGDIIASTDPAGSQHFTGTFFFKEPDFARSYRAIVEELTRGSLSFDDFMKERDPAYEPAAKTLVKKTAISGRGVEPTTAAPQPAN